jgi:hypothetical protein
VYPPIVARQWLSRKRQIVGVVFYAVRIYSRKAGYFISKNTQNFGIMSDEMEQIWKAVVVGLIVVLTWLLLQGTEKNCETPVPAEIRTENLLNACIQHYHN